MIAWLAVDPAVASLLRFALGAILLRASWHKLRHLEAFAKDLSAYEILPARMSRSAAILFGITEAGLAMGLVVLPRLPVSIAVIGLLILYSTAIAINLRRGRTRIACGCTGLHADQPLRAGLIVRNAGLIAAASVCTLPSSPRAFLAVDAFTAVTGAAVLFLLYLASETGMANHTRQRAWGTPG